MTVLSIDIGLRNLGYALFDKEQDKLSFGVYDVDGHLRNKKDLVVSRSLILKDFIDSLFKEHEITDVIIERQVSSNIQAMEIMYLLTGIISNYTTHIKIFDPKLKFTRLNLKYSTKNKEHKKLSVAIVKNYIEANYNDLLEEFTTHMKQDDIADAILMILVTVYKNDKAKLVFIRSLFPDV